MILKRDEIRSKKIKCSQWVRSIVEYAGSCVFWQDLYRRVNRVTLMQLIQLLLLQTNTGK